MKLLTVIMFFCITTNAFCNNSFQIKQIPIVFNIDSFENAVNKTKNTNDANCINTLFSLEYSRYFFSVASFGKNLPQLYKKIAANKNLIPYYNLFLGIEKFRNKNALDTTLELFYSCITPFEQNKDTIALILVYSRLIDLQMLYKNDIVYNNKRNDNLVDELYNKCFKLAANTNDEFAKLYYYFISLRYCMYWKNNEMEVLQHCQNALTLISHQPNPHFKYAASYIYLYKSHCYTKLNLEDSTIMYLKLSIKTVYPQSNADLASMLQLIEKYKFSHSIRHSIDSAIVYLNQVQKRLATSKISLYEFSVYCSHKIDIAWMQKQYDSVKWYSRLKDSVLALLQVEMYKIPLQKVSDDFKNTQLKLKKSEVEKQNVVIKMGAYIALLIMAMAILFYMAIKKKNKKLVSLINYKSKIETIISHDLKSPILGLTQLYQQYNYWVRKKDNTQIELISNRIDEASLIINSVLNGLLHWAVETKPSHNKSIYLYKSVDTTIQLYNTIAVSHQIKITNNIAQQIQVLANPNIVELIMRNWLDNVLKYAKPNQVAFYAQIETAHTLKLCIIDNGTVSQENFEKINQIVNSNTKTITDAYGFGLSLIAEFAVKENWNIHFEINKNENMFTIVLPC